MTMKLKWNAADRARHKAIREQYRNEPTQDELHAVGDHEVPVKAGAYRAVKQLLHEFKQARQDAGLTLADVSKLTGMDQATLSRHETGRQPNPTIDTLWRYAHAVGRNLRLHHTARPANNGKPAKPAPATPVVKGFVMRRIICSLLCVVILGLTLILAAQPQTVKLTLALRDETGAAIPGMMQIVAPDGKSLEIPGLFARTAGLTKDMPGIHWYVIPKDGAQVTLPRGKFTLRAVAGLETSLGETKIDLTGKTPGKAVVELRSLFRPEQQNLVAGNTHLHLRGFSLDTADEYIRKIPAADNLRVLFVSYLERDKDDLTYITNKYPIGDLPKLSVSGVLVNNGEEHRHNFLGYGEGYGHVMFLNLKQLVRPVSIGAGIMSKGPDDPALRPGIDDARKQGATVIWCHNTNGFEDVPSAVTGRLDALNVFDGSRTGLFEDNYYRYLNIGLRMPISTGTDWFMYDFSRVYAEVPGKLTISSWLDAVKAGRCQATNGPLLTLSVGGKKMGDVVDLKEVTTLKIAASAIGRHSSQKLQLIQNGKVIKTQMQRDPHKVELTHEVRVDGPGWFALRIDSDAKDEFNRKLFAHSSPVYVNFDGKGVFDVDAASALLKQVQEGRGTIEARAKFSAATAGKDVLAIYDEAAKILRDRIDARK